MNTKSLHKGAAKLLLSALLLVSVYGASFAQDRVLIHEFKLLNETPEELPEFGKFLTDSAFATPILEVLEKGIRSKLGELPIDYYSGRQIDQLSMKVNPYTDPKEQFRESIAQFRAYNARFKKGSKQDHQYIVIVETKFLEPGPFKSRENVRFRMSVRIREKGNGKVFSGRTNYNFTVHTPDFLMDEIRKQPIALYQNFPLSKEEIQLAYINGLEQIFFNQEKSKDQYVNRSEYDAYSDFIYQADRAYSLLVPVGYGYSTVRNVKFRLLGIPLISARSRHSDLLAGPLSETRKGRIQIREKRFSGLGDLEVGGPAGTGFRNFNRTFLLNSELFAAPYSTYYLKGSIQDVFTLGVPVGDPFTNAFRLNLYNEQKMLKSDMRVHNLGVAAYDETEEESVTSLDLSPISSTATPARAKSLHRILRNHGRIYTPYLKTEGELLGKRFALISNPLCLNNVELYYGNEMVGLITHSKPTKKQLKRKKDVIPHVLYLKGDLSTEEEALILQSFQLMRIGYAMNSMQRGRNRGN